MDKKTLLKIVTLFFIINGLLFMMIESAFPYTMIFRIFLFCMIGIFAGRYVYHKVKITDRNFGFKVIILVLLWLLYSSYDFDYKSTGLYMNICISYFGVNIDPIDRLPLIFLFIYDSFLERYAIACYILSYFSYGFTRYILSQRKSNTVVKNT